MILGLGHPRTGTKYTAKLCAVWGLKVGHEVPQKDGVVGWQYVKEVGPYPFDANPQKRRPNYDVLVYNTRDPRETLSSVIYTEDIVEKSFEFRFKLNDIPCENFVEFAISSIITFDNLITAMKPTITYRIEDQQEELFDCISQFYPHVKYREFTKKMNPRKHPALDEILSFQSVSTKHQDLLSAYCEKHGYSPIQF